VLYGANASGKSNVIHAMLTLRSIIGNGSVSQTANQVLFNLELFPFVHDGNTEPISFEIEFIAGEDRFIYGITISVEPFKRNGKRRILEEKLEQILSKGTVMLFHRTKDNIVVGSDKYALKILGYKNAEDIRLLVRSVVQNMDEETLFLTGGFRSTIRKDVANKIINCIIYNTLVEMNLPNMLLSNKLIVSDEEILSGDIIFFEKMIDIIVKAADFGPQRIGWRVKEKEENKQGVNELEMVSIYQNKIFPSGLMESSGTIRLLRFSLKLRPFFLNGGVLMIDEMDNAIHPEIMKGIIALFGNPKVNKNGAQLIFTTHNPIYMDNGLLRRDQIIFTERDTDTYESTLHSLGDFGSVSVRNDQSFMRNYFKGRYSRLPYIDLESILIQGMEV
jgi:AAA15 family ATPase/GTPase